MIDPGVRFEVTEIRDSAIAWCANRGDSVASEGFRGRAVQALKLICGSACGCAVAAPWLLCVRSANAVVLLGGFSAVVGWSVVPLSSLCGCSVVFLGLLGAEFAFRLLGGCSRDTLALLSACCQVAVVCPQVALRLF